MSGPILFPGRLPEGALVSSACDRERSNAPAGAPAPVWFSFFEGVPAEERVREWHAAAGAATAVAVPRNEAGTLRTASGALRFTARENGGFVVAGAIPDCATASVAAIVLPDRKKAAETILTLQPADGSGYVFVAHDGERVRIGRKDDDLDISTASPNGHFLVVFGLSGGRVQLSVNGARTDSRPLDLAGPADLYIGCRGAQGGLKNKLGAFQLTDVMVWPDTDVLSVDGAGAALNLLARRGGHGV